MPVFPNLNKLQRRQKEPNKFLSVKNLILFKPVYRMDLKSFMRKAPLIYPKGVPSTDTSTVAGMHLTESALLPFVINIIHAAKVMHDNNIIHRDIKPKNIMISNSGNPVLIDYGFARTTNKNQMCIIQPGILKGELKYVLGEDVAKYQACQRGDVYAMGKTLYEFIFCLPNNNLSVPSDRFKIDRDDALKENEIFRSMIFNNAGDVSRFVLSRQTADFLVLMIRGLCRVDDPLSFAEAEMILLDYVR